MSPILEKVKALVSGQSRRGKRGEKKEAHTAKQQKKETGVLKCSHRFGYLATLSKKAPIPEECLTCLKMLECRNAYG